MSASPSPLEPLRPVFARCGCGTTYSFIEGESFTCGCGGLIGAACHFCGHRATTQYGLINACRRCMIAQPRETLERAAGIPAQFASGGPVRALDVEIPRPPASANPPRLTGKIIGYRGWTLDGYRLVSANARQHAGWWKIGPNKAECRLEQRIAYITQLGGPIAAQHLWQQARSAGVHDAPHPDCECGLYAYFDVCREHNPHFSATAKSFVWGAIAAWGHVEVHAGGFRAEYAEPIALGYDPGDPPEQVGKHRAIAEELGLPFVQFDELEAEAVKHGQPVPKDLRPEYTSPLQGIFSQVAANLAAVNAMSVSIHRAARKFEEAQAALTHTLIAMEPLTITAEQMREIFAPLAHAAPSAISKPRKPKGVKATLKTSGPPFTGRWREHDMVKDRKGDYWTCTASGTPGSWERA